MATLTLPDISCLHSLSDDRLTDMLDLLFEPSEDIHTLLLPTLRNQIFSSYPSLIDTTRSTLLSLQTAFASDTGAEKTLLAILGSHPRLGAKKVDSALSAAEQAQLNAAEGSGEAVKLAKMNAEYEAKFPGLRYVVFVNGRSRDAIMENMKERISRGKFDKELVEAIEVRRVKNNFFL